MRANSFDNGLHDGQLSLRHDIEDVFYEPEYEFLAAYQSEEVSNELH